MAWGKEGRKDTISIMDMWRAFEASTMKNATNTARLYDKFHVIRHLGEALEDVKKVEYLRLHGKKRRYSKEQKLVLLSNRENLTLVGKTSLRKLLKTNKNWRQYICSKKHLGNYGAIKWKDWHGVF